MAADTAPPRATAQAVMAARGRLGLRPRFERRCAVRETRVRPRTSDERLGLASLAEPDGGCCVRRRRRVAPPTTTARSMILETPRRRPQLDRPRDPVLRLAQRRPCGDRRICSRPLVGSGVTGEHRRLCWLSRSGHRALAPPVPSRPHGRALHGPHHGRRPGHAHAVRRCPRCCTGSAASRWSSGSSMPPARRAPAGWCASCGPGDGVAEGLPDGGRGRRAARGRGHRRRRARRARRASSARPGGGPLGRPSARHRGADRRAGGDPRRADERRRDAAHHRACSTRRATAASCATRDGEFERIVETKYTRGGRRPRSSPSARSTSAPTCSTPPSCSARSTRSGDEHGERYLTGVLPLLRERGRRVVTHLTDDATSALGRERPRRPDGGRGPGPAPHPRGPRARGRDLPRAGDASVSRRA